ncbi:uncharacterized protein [Lolium perenne]|uniref:uncharacterized protein n=1 Tax=Lolium perenne TaxID=4522 RepID=UPI003A992D88
MSNLNQLKLVFCLRQRLKYHDSGREKDVLPRVGQWNMMNKKTVSCAPARCHATPTPAARTTCSTMDAYYLHLLRSCSTPRHAHTGRTHPLPPQLLTPPRPPPRARTTCSTKCHASTPSPSTFSSTPTPATAIPTLTCGPSTRVWGSAVCG